MAQEHVLITGGAGFVGRHIVDSLVELYPEHHISIFDLHPPTSWNLPRDDIAYISGDIRSLTDCRNAIEQSKATAIIHTAGIVPTGNDRYTERLCELTFAINVGGTETLLSACKSSTTVRAFIFTSSITTVTDDNRNNYPNFDESQSLTATLVYGRSKAAAERLVLAANDPSNGFVTCALRPSVICGPGDYQLVTTIQKCIAKFETPFVVGSATNLYDFTYVTNIADAHVLALRNLLTSKTAAGEAFIITNGSPIPFRAFCLAIWAHFGHVPPFEVVLPRWLAWGAGWCMEWATWLMGSEATLSRGSVRDYCQTAYADVRKARDVLGYVPRVGLAEGVRLSCEELNERLAKKNEGKMANGHATKTWGTGDLGVVIAVEAE